MKYILFFCTVLLFSCSSAKQDYNVINDFLETELANKKVDTLFVSREGTPKMYMLELYETAYNERNGEEELVWVLPKITNWPLDSLDIVKEKNIKREKNNWIRFDFKNKNYIPTYYKSIRSIPFSLKHISASNFILYLSRPVFSKDKKHSMFLFSIGCIPFGGCLTENYGLIVMEKKKGKWVQISNIKYQVYY